MERSTPVRKSHASTVDLPTWSEIPPSYSPSIASVACSHQPSDGISKVVFGGQVIDEEVENLNKRSQRLYKHILWSLDIDKHPVIILSGSIIRFAEQSLDPEMRSSFFSPRLMEAVIWFIARWSRTYLMATEENMGNRDNYSSNSDQVHHLQSHYSRKAWITFFGDGNHGELILDIIVRISTITLVSYPGEKDLQTRNAISGTYLASQRFASSVALLIGNATAMRDHKMFVFEDIAGSTVA